MAESQHNIRQRIETEIRAYLSLIRPEKGGV
jgi:hypothetical protein